MILYKYFEEYESKLLSFNSSVIELCRFGDFNEYSNGKPNRLISVFGTILGVVIYRILKKII